ncbi:hypothetical protein [Streptomyces sp. GC420]|uniref:hypothetical protein n=1 Tax=Streptomyces sp. GC420 TaxID=2697568 RepID=UPI001414F9DF|nr:hypothetical protein [Streptomyces sp. GC420]NBM20710.1 hypothetical protein [Streptomyces sp. GC420]
MDARAGAWAQWGDLDDDVITHLVSPMFSGGPTWPNIRQAYRVARRGGELLVASDGLSDPFAPLVMREMDVDPEEPSNGFGYEFYATTADPIDRIPGSWLFDLVWQVSQLGALQDLGGTLDRLTLVSTELYDVRIPRPYTDRFVNVHRRVGVLLGLAGTVPTRIAGPLSPIRLVSVKLLTLPELEYAVRNGSEGRRELRRRLTAQGSLLTSGLDRPSVV